MKATTLLISNSGLDRSEGIALTDGSDGKIIKAPTASIGVAFEAGERLSEFSLWRRGEAVLAYKPVPEDGDVFISLTGADGIQFDAGDLPIQGLGNYRPDDPEVADYGDGEYVDAALVILRADSDCYIRIRKPKGAEGDGWLVGDVTLRVENGELTIEGPDWPQDQPADDQEAKSQPDAAAEAPPGDSTAVTAGGPTATAESDDVSQASGGSGGAGDQEEGRGDQTGG